MKNSKKALTGVCLALALMTAGCAQMDVVTSDMVDFLSFGRDYSERPDPDAVKRVVVTPFLYGKIELAALARKLQNVVEESFRQEERLRLLNFIDLQKAGIEFGATELIIEDRYLSGARHMGLNLVVTGEVSGLYVDYNLEGWYGFRQSTPQVILEGQIKVVDAIRGVVRSIRAFREKVEVDDVLAQAILTGKPTPEEIVQKLFDAVVANNREAIIANAVNTPWSGVVLAVDGVRALVTAGRDTGLQTGSRLTLYSKSERLQTGGGHSVYLLSKPVGDIILHELGETSSWGEVVFYDQENSYGLEPGQLVKIP